MNRPGQKVKVVGTERISGSIHAVYASTEITITDCSTGEYVSLLDSGSNFVDINSAKTKNRVDHVTTDDIVIPAGKSIYGPFLALNISGGTGIVYYTGTLAPNNTPAP
tara:strand:+ start:871 stop:1194 length:324 start_codon:yes stop_codon:yes gene_type:complete